MPELTANGLHFYVVTEGQGPLVILLHGFPDTSQLWRHQIPTLVATGYRANLPPERLAGPPPQLPAVQAPTLGIFSTGDSYLTEDAMLRSAAFVQGPWRYERIAGIGHWVPAEAPAELNRLLLEFLRT